MNTLKTLALLIFISIIPNNSFCKEPVIINDLIVATQQSEETNTKLLLVFTADWCKYCVYLKDDLMENMDMVNEKYTVCFVDYDTNPDLVRKYNVTKIPVSLIVPDKIKRTGYSRDFNNYRNFLGL